ncbi:hypothetical protein EUGRSUZ_I00928 [Eucalyptus grandis]|uniref:Uncharacterized protein n=2 Tax=Eucalyptus grandis TaxID=71139 RepID=A0ACC3JDQ3_EUCGR|nr:hypothetical protein EUGRSUZ_I00928 [Eucalyptus grandis]
MAALGPTLHRSWHRRLRLCPSIRELCPVVPGSNTCCVSTMQINGRLGHCLCVGSMLRFLSGSCQLPYHALAAAYILRKLLKF